MGVWYAVLALVNLLAGGFLVTSTYGFDAETATNVGFALSIAVCVIGLAMGYVGMESTNRGERIGLGVLGYATAALAGWTVIATQVFEPDTAKWLVFGSGIGHIALSVAGVITEVATAGKPAVSRGSSASRSRSSGASRSRSTSRSRSSSSRSRARSR
jgi:hypothetical protein